MLTVRRYRITIPLPTSVVRFAPRYEEPLLRLQFAAHLASLQLPVTLEEIRPEIAHHAMVWQNFARVEDEIQRLAGQYQAVKDKFGTPAIQAAFPEGIRRAILEEIEAAEAHLEAAAVNIEAPEDFVAMKIPEAVAKLMAANGWHSAAHLASADPLAVAALEGVRLTQARKWVKAAAAKAGKAFAGVLDEIPGAAATAAPVLPADAQPMMTRRDPKLPSGPDPELLTNIARRK
jgi:hypothetical protein